jgi:nucleotide-binding universal stress UspA family protein
MRVVVAYDGGDAGERAIAAIASWVRTTDADVDMFTILDPSDVHETSLKRGAYAVAPAVTPTGKVLNIGNSTPALAEDRTHAFERARTEAEQQLHDVARRNFPGVSLSVHAEVTDRPPAEAIVAAARRLGADVIAVGTHSRTGLRHALMGSVAEAVVRSSPIPVLVIGPGVIVAGTATVPAE